MTKPSILTTIKLAKLPNRKSVKMTITLSAELAEKLHAYAVAYHKAYGDDEDAATLVPFMLATFIDADRHFSKSFATGRAHSAPDEAATGGDGSAKARGRAAPR